MTFNYKVGRIESKNDLQYDVLISPANCFDELKGCIDIDSMYGKGIIHAINMTKKEEDDNTFGLPHFMRQKKCRICRI